VNRPPLQVLGELSATLTELNTLAAKRTKLIRELSNDATVKSSEVSDFLQLGKIPDADITQLLNDFERVRT